MLHPSFFKLPYIQYALKLLLYDLYLITDLRASSRMQLVMKMKTDRTNENRLDIINRFRTVNNNIIIFIDILFTNGIFWYSEHITVNISYKVPKAWRYINSFLRQKNVFSWNTVGHTYVRWNLSKWNKIEKWELNILINKKILKHVSS